MAQKIYLPGDDKRVVIMGRTGSGKSVGGAWQLSQRGFHEFPWIIFDPKRDELLEEIGAFDFHWRTKLRLPDKPGLYKFSPVPGQDDTAIERVLQAIIAQRRTGLYADEGYSIPKASPAFRRIQTQGRSLRIPTITLTQRPVWLDRFTVSEADFFQQFHLQDRRDRDTLEAFVGYDPHEMLAPYCSHWYDVGRNMVAKLGPVPSPDAILETFHHRLGVRKRRRFL